MCVWLSYTPWERASMHISLSILQKGLISSWGMHPKQQDFFSSVAHSYIETREQSGAVDYSQREWYHSSSTSQDHICLNHTRYTHSLISYISIPLSVYPSRVCVDYYQQILEYTNINNNLWEIAESLSLIVTHLSLCRTHQSNSPHTRPLIALIPPYPCKFIHLSPQLCVVPYSVINLSIYTQASTIYSLLLIITRVWPWAEMHFNRFSR